MPLLRPALLALVLLLSRPAGAQDIPAVGTEATFDVATWNVEWFGAGGGPSDDEQQLQNVRAVIESAGVELWAFQEISDPGDFARLLDGLGAPWDGQLATYSQQQKLAFVWDSTVVRPRSVRAVLESSSADFAGRPPLQLVADVTLGDTTVTMTFVTVHMKAFADRDSYEQRERGATRLKSHLDFGSNSLGSLRSQPVVVLGDFNDELVQSIYNRQPSPYDNLVDDAADFRFLTWELDESDDYTFCQNAACSSGSTIDHVLITDELFSAHRDAAAATYDELLQAVRFYLTTTSDHLPVYARFSFVDDTSAPAEQPAAVAGLAAYPSPFAARTTVRYSLAAPSRVTLDVFDLLGRRVARLADGFRAAGSHEAVLDGTALPQGLYLVRLEADGRSRTLPVVRASH